MATKEKPGREALRLKVRFEIDPEGATKLVLDAITASHGALPAAAAQLAISERSLDRLLAERPSLGNAAKAARDAAKAAREAARDAAKGAA